MADKSDEVMDSSALFEGKPEPVFSKTLARVWSLHLVKKEGNGVDKNEEL